MLVLRHAERKPVPWKNGLGITYDVARRDDDDGMLWRVSIAVCDKACPFSRFEGIDRHLLVIDGDPMRLEIEGRSVVLGVGSAPVEFPGEATVACEPLGQPTFDLNLMTRRGSGDGSVYGPRPVTWAGGPAILVVVGQHAEIAGHTLEKFDALTIDDGELVTYSLEAALSVACIKPPEQELR